MDPNANLQEQAEILARNIERLAGTLDDYEKWVYSDDRSRLRELRIALRDWLQSGGFSPDWAKAPLASRYFGM